MYGFKKNIENGHAIAKIRIHNIRGNGQNKMISVQNLGEAAWRIQSEK